jgi:hypothetical protein
MNDSQDQEVINGDALIGRPEVEAGKVDDLHEKSTEPRIRMDEARTARRLAYTLTLTLVGSFVLHYIAVGGLQLYNRPEAVEVLSEIFDKWLPVISGFTGTAVAYYLRERSK